MGIFISILDSASEIIYAGIGILLPELLFAYIAFYFVKDEGKRLKIFLWLTTILMVGYVSLGVAHLALTYNLLEHNNADYRNGTRWDVSIYENKSLSDSPVFNGVIYGLPNGLQIDWGFGSPKKNLPQDNFSATFSTSQSFSAGLYCFVMLVDDGAKLSVGNTLLINHYHGFTPAAVFKEPIQLDSGVYPIIIQYYDDLNTASIHVFWYELHGDECQSINEP
ncbi:MAG: PA14 domain-containing protein [Candidatus Pacebacteria bacterium]|nr:PA14 domain-containing protein [Candidatus Paceibacterota bacterium]